MGTTELFTVAGVVGSRRELESQPWKLETHPTAGRALVLSKVESGPATPQELALLQRQALARLQRWGIPTSELGPIRQMQSFIQASRARRTASSGRPRSTVTRRSCCAPSMASAWRVTARW